jgi:hypothetical protein
MRALVLLLSLSVACGEAVREKPAVDRPAPEIVASPHPVDLEALSNAVDAIPAAPRDEAAIRIRTALDLVASAVARRDVPSGRELSHLSTQLATARTGQVVLVRQALDLALDGLVADLTHDRPDAVRHAYMMARRSAKLVTPSEPLRFQLVEVGATLRSITNLIAARRGEDIVYQEPAVERDVGYDPALFRERVRRASKLVTVLSMERDWEVSVQNAADALDAIADLVEVSPLSLTDEQWRVLVRSIRYNAIALATDDGIDRSALVKAGLRAATEALSQLEHGVIARRPLRVAARSAVESIDDRGLFMMQRGILQEAFRSTADAFATIDVGESRQSSPASRMEHACRC